MDEKDYELLLDLSETKNITKTASRLYMTQLRPHDLQLQKVSFLIPTISY